MNLNNSNTEAGLVLGIDTSNYTTSVAVTDLSGRFVFEERRLLAVKQGQRGLQQSHVLFQHGKNLPELLHAVMEKVRDRSRILAVSASDRPRPVEGSYMPAFLAGLQFGTVIASALDIPFFSFSHQEGHLAAVLPDTPIAEEQEFLAFHLSGGTCELLHVNQSTILVIGGSKDLSYGQVLDRIGVSLQYSFPCGEELDRIACSLLEQGKDPQEVQLHLRPVFQSGLWINLSGLETEVQRRIQQGHVDSTLILDVFEKIAQSLASLTRDGIRVTGCRNVLFVGGVSSSRYLAQRLPFLLRQEALLLAFGPPACASDNAIGIARLGATALLSGKKTDGVQAWE